MISNNSELEKFFLNNREKYKYIAHRLGFKMTGYPENSLDSLVEIFENQEILETINGIEFDIQFTSDHIPILIHDLNTSDISEFNRTIGKTSFADLKKIKCGYRRSDYNSDIPWQDNKNYTLQSLDSVMSFLMENRNKLADRIIKIETKSPFLSREDIKNLKKLLDKYEDLKDNLVHISFFPWNLKKLREEEKFTGSKPIKTELLVDYNFERPLETIWSSSIDGISLGLKNEKTVGTIKIDIAARITSFLNAFFYERRNAVSEKWLGEIINRYGYVGLYTINDIKNIAELMRRVLPKFIEENATNLIITSDNPIYLKKIK